MNGVQITDFSTESYPSQNYDTDVNDATLQSLGKPGWHDGVYFDGYMAEMNFIDGTQLTPSSFGETKNGVWIPKSVSGLTYGTLGFRLTLFVFTFFFYSFSFPFYFYFNMLKRFLYKLSN